MSEDRKTQQSTRQTRAPVAGAAHACSHAVPPTAQSHSNGLAPPGTTDTITCSMSPPLHVQHALKSSVRGVCLTDGCKPSPHLLTRIWKPCGEHCTDARKESRLWCRRFYAPTFNKVLQLAWQSSPHCFQPSSGLSDAAGHVSRTCLSRDVQLGWRRGACRFTPGPWGQDEAGRTRQAQQHRLPQRGPAPRQRRR